LSYVFNVFWDFDHCGWREVSFYGNFFWLKLKIDGNRFREECKTAGKNLMVWTVNLPDHMMEVCAAFYVAEIVY